MSCLTIESICKFCLMMEKVNISALNCKQKQYEITLCMWGDVLLDHVDQMLKWSHNLALCMMYNVPNNQLNRKLYFCNGMNRIDTYLYFNKFLFNWCSIFIKCRDFFCTFVNSQIVGWFQFEGFENKSILMILKRF
jgi:hypothetical protein